MDTTIRNIDERAYRELKARASLEGKTVGEAISDAIRTYLARAGAEGTKDRSLGALEPEPYPEGNENLSLEIDAVVHGV